MSIRENIPSCLVGSLVGGPIVDHVGYKVIGAAIRVLLLQLRREEVAKLNRPSDNSQIYFHAEVIFLSACTHLMGKLTMVGFFST